MSVGLPSDEVAEDYKSSLEDLVQNSRIEISNLTVIAKENTEHAMAISRVLENHIRNTRPDRKLPAMYVLDSIVKNIGTPYTLFLGRNLYHTFMNAYSLVSHPIRRKLEEMLKTWTQSVPGSLDDKPVFPVDVTRPIETALIKAGAAAAVQQQQQQQQFQIRHGPTPNNGWRNTPTPPQVNGQFRPPVPGYVQQGYPPHSHTPQPISSGQFQGPPPVQHYPQQYHQQPQHGPPGPAPGSYHQPYPPTPQPNPNFHTYNNPGHDVYLLNMDIERLIKQARIDFGANVHDTSIQTRLKALLDLQGILQKQQLPPSDIKMIRDQVNALSHPPPMPPVPTPQPFSMAGPVPQPAYSQYPQVQSPYLQQAAQQNNAFNHLQPPAQVPSTQAPDLSSLLASNNLAAILAKAQRSTPTPPQSYAQLAMSVTTASAPVAIPAAIAGPGALPGSDLMASLRAAGLVISDQNAGNGTGFAPVTPPVGFSALSSSLPMNDLDLTSASLKRTHIELVAHLYEARPNQCTTCGRRFLATNDGRQQKAHHLDWHFRTNQRIADASKRGQSRSWYVDELDWIKSQDDPENTLQATGTPEGGLMATSAKAVVDPKSKYVPVPSDQALANLPCPICQEKFETVWNEDAQDFVWMDAVRVGARIYHASCYSDIKKDGRSTPLLGGRTGTPDSVLGKRKASD